MRQIKTINNQRGQALLEFCLLGLAAAVFSLWVLSLGFVMVATLIVDDYLFRGIICVESGNGTQPCIDSFQASLKEFEGWLSITNAQYSGGAHHHQLMAEVSIRAFPKGRWLYNPSVSVLRKSIYQGALQ